MSGVEVIGLISAAISIFDAVTTLFDAIKDAQGLPQAFREVAARLPLVQDVLQTVAKQVNKSHIDDGSYEAMKTLLESCKSKASALETVLQKTISPPEASRLERYYLAVKSLGKGNRVEILMKGILQDMQLLVGNNALKAASESQVQTLLTAVEELSTIPPSAPDEDGSHIYLNYGSGPQAINNDGTQNINTGSGHQFNAPIQTLQLGKN